MHIYMYSVSIIWNFHKNKSFIFLNIDVPMHILNNLKKIRTNIDNPRFSLSLFFLFIILFVVKLEVIYTSYVNISPLKYCFAHFISDYYYLLIILFFLTVCLYSKNKIIKYLSNVINLLLIIIYCTDIFSIYYFQARESLLGLLNLTTWVWYWWLWFSKLIVLYVLISILWMIGFIYIVNIHFLSIKRVFYKLLSPQCFLLYYLLWIFLYCLQPIMIKYNIPDVQNILSVNIETIKRIQESKMPIFTDKNYKDYVKYESGDGKNLNVILVFLESFSAIDSARLWWNNNTPYLDKIQEDWITFPNFVSNWVASHQAHVSVFLWIPPIREDYNYNSNYLIFRWLINFLNKWWYNTTFISTVPLSFIKQRSFLSWVWFQKIIWEENFEHEKKYTFYAAPDELLYRKALQEVQNQTGTFLIWLQTISFHGPYDTPLWKTENLALKYSDQELWKFYVQLQNLWFFDNWILIVIWDHRKQTPVEKWEYSIFWPTWKWKSVVTVVWSWIGAWKINNNFLQHTDFYYSIKKLLLSGDLEMNIFYNDVFSSTANRDRWIVDIAWVGEPSDNTMLLLKHWESIDIDYYYDNKEAYDYYLFLKNFLLKNEILLKSL